MEVRQSRRIRVQCPCSFAGRGVQGEGIVLNVSRPGCAVQSETPVTVGSRLALHLLVPIHFFPVAVDDAEVVWSQRKRFGVKFVRVRAEHEARLQRLLDQHLRPQQGGPATPRVAAPPSPGAVLGA